jgi:enoyl-[acyl-carrier protein] reductase II
LVIEGMEAGGHIGAVSTSVLAQEILPTVREIPVFVAGGIGRGEAILSYLEMGAAGCQLGTRFVCARESIAHPRRAFIRAAARCRRLARPRHRCARWRGDQTFRRRAMMSSPLQSRARPKAARLEVKHFWAGARPARGHRGRRRNRLADGRAERRHGEQPTAAILRQLVDQAVAALVARDEADREPVGAAG